MQMFTFFSRLKGLDSEDLLRKCVLHYCPLDMMIQQSDNGDF